MNHLTQKERNALDEAMAVILDHLAPGASWQFYAANYIGSVGKSFSACYFDSGERQYSSMHGTKFSDIVEKGLAHEAKAERNESRLREMRVASLRKQLAELTGEPA